MKARWVILAGCVSLLAMYGLAWKFAWPAHGNDWFPFAVKPPQMKPSPEEELRLHPLAIESPADLANTVPDRELEHILELLEPHWEYWRASDLLHSLRLWGPEAVFPQQAVFNVPDKVRAIASAEMLPFFLDEKGSTAGGIHVQSLISFPAPAVWEFGKEPYPV